MIRASSIGVLALACLLLGSCYSRRAYMQQKNMARNARTALDDLGPYVQDLEREVTDLKAENAQYKKTVPDVAWVKEQKAKLQKLLEEYRGLAGDTGIKGVTVVGREGGGVGFRIQGQVLFQSGRAELTAEGNATLKKLQPLLTKPGKTIRIDGHADRDPIRRSSWKSNLQLSAARAYAVADFLMRNGVPETLIVTAGYGMSRPASATDKAMNRRVEIFLEGK